MRTYESDELTDDIRRIVNNIVSKKNIDKSSTTWSYPKPKPAVVVYDELVKTDDSQYDELFDEPTPEPKPSPRKPTDIRKRKITLS